VDQWLTKKDRFPALVEQREEAQTERERGRKRAKDPPFEIHFRYLSRTKSGCTLSLKAYPLPHNG
jgi:hypothetical protein